MNKGDVKITFNKRASIFETERENKFSFNPSKNQPGATIGVKEKMSHLDKVGK